MEHAIVNRATSTPAAPAPSAAGRTGGPPPAVSIVIVNFNGATLLRDCLDSLARVAEPLHEIIVVDNGSSDDSLSVLAAYPGVRVVRSATNLGFAGGNNLGLQSCAGRYVLLLNNDTIVTPDFLEPLCARLDAHPEVGVVQGKMLLPRHGGTLDTCGSYLTALGFLYHRGYYKPDGPQYRRSRAVFTAKGACLMFRRDLVERVGGYLFNQDFFCYYEETDFCHRVWLAGFEVHFVPDSVIQHLQGATSEAAHRDGFVLRQYLRNQTFALLSNLGPWSLLRIMPLYGLVFLASLLLGALTFRKALVLAHAHAAADCLRHWRRIRDQRRRIRQIRKVRDAAIFRRVLRTPRLEYFVKTFTGRLAQYVDDDLA